MKFALNLSLKNIKRRPLRTLSIGLLVMILAYTIFAGGFTILSLQKGLSSYQARLGADIIVVPKSAVSHDNVDDIFLQGITGNYYMTSSDYTKIKNIEGIEEISRQFYLTSAKASCCSTRVQIIGFDPDTDFSIQPWIHESYQGDVKDGDIIVGYNINVPTDKRITFYGNEYHVVAKLEKTGTGLDSAVYTNMTTIQEMAHNASRLLETSPFQNVDISTASSSVLIKVKEGYSIEGVNDDINIHITKVEATSSKSMIQTVSDGLGQISKIAGILIIVICLLALIILMIVFIMLVNERKKEFAILRVLGASQSLIFQVMTLESILVSLIGGLTGIGLSLITVLPLSGMIKNALSLPFLVPDIFVLGLLILITLLISVGAGTLTSILSSRKFTSNETGLLLREDV